MYCPICKTSENSVVYLKSEGFREELQECSNCGSIWSINHGKVEVVTDSHERSFLSALTECVESDDYSLNEYHYGFR